MTLVKSKPIDVFDIALYRKRTPPCPLPTTRNIIKHRRIITIVMIITKIKTTHKIVNV